MRAAFTLLELLVVVTVIAILFAILFPVLWQARERARAAVCLSNLRELGLALRIYVDDWDGRLPGAGLAGRPYAGDWVRMRGDRIDIAGGSLFPYARHAGIYACPSAPGLLTYAMNFFVERWREAAIRAPAACIVLAEQELRGPDSIGVNDGYMDVRARQDRVTKRHHGAGAVLYADGHTRRARPEQVDFYGMGREAWLP